MAVRIRRQLLARAAFVAARSPSAAARVLEWGSTGVVELVPHCVPDWQARPRRAWSRRMTVGYAGRLTPAKGIDDLLAAASMVGNLTLLIVGDGPLRDALKRVSIPTVDIRVVTGITHAEMGSIYGQVDVLVLPSRTTRSWSEQFGWVLVEGLWCGTPVIGSSSGDIPWVIETTSGGLVFTERDPNDLAAKLRQFRDEPDLRSSLARNGARSAKRLFSSAAAARALDGLLRAVTGARP